MTRDLLFMGDYTADPLWDARTEAMVNVDRLPVSANVREALREWAKRWEALANAQLRIDGGQNQTPDGLADVASQQAWEDLAGNGQSLCEQLRRELGGGWRVGWVVFHDDQRHVQWAKDEPPSLFLPGAGRPRDAPT
jgi:hypothetical protein